MVWGKVILLLCIGVFIFRLFQLQILQGNYYYKIAELNRTQYFHIPAPRGRIFDRHGNKLTGNQPQYTLFVSVNNISKDEKEKISRGLGNITDYKREYIFKRFVNGEKMPFGNIRLLPNLTREDVQIIEENIHNYPRLSVQIEPRREYPYRQNGSHLLGHIGEISPRELDVKSELGYSLGDRIGKTGLEKKYDRILRGKSGLQKLEVGVRGEHKEILKTVDPKIGNDLLLTVDWDLQQRAWKAMEDKQGGVVAMNPQTGEILIWFSKPGFNPEDFTVSLSDNRARKIFIDPGYPLFNRILQGQYEPGSIFKLVTTLAALDTGKATVDKEFTCRGSIRIGHDRQKFRCWKEHGTLKLREAIARSCNVYFYRLGLETKINSIKNTAGQLGFGKPVQDIFEREATGNIPGPRWKKDKYSRGWYPGDTANTSVGQGYVLVTPMQILNLTSVIANRGQIPDPHILKMEISSQGQVVNRNLPEDKGRVKIDKRYFKIVEEAMAQVTEYGTASYLNMPFPVAGKTGTAQNPSGEDHAWFTCYAPVNDPQIAITVFVERGGHGSVGALPVAREVLKEKFLSKEFSEVERNNEATD
ncbi:MAG: penicillin-binding protein 2 [Elusimicrobiota bacterium]